MSKSVQHVQKHLKKSELCQVFKRVQICVMCPKLSKGVQNTKIGSKVEFFFWDTLLCTVYVRQIVSVQWKVFTIVYVVSSG